MWLTGMVLFDRQGLRW